MNDSPNPYAAPLSDFREAPPAATDISDSKAIELLVQTRPWVLVVSVTAVLVAGALFLWNVVLVGQMFRNPNVLSVALVPAIVNFVFLTVLGTGGWLLGRYAERIRRLSLERTTLRFHEALAAQRSFWRLAGVSILVLIACYASLLVAGAMFWHMIGRM